jgi:hypothetical protein
MSPQNDERYWFCSACQFKNLVLGWYCSGCRGEWKPPKTAKSNVWPRGTDAHKSYANALSNGKLCPEQGTANKETKPKGRGRWGGNPTKKDAPPKPVLPETDSKAVTKVKAPKTPAIRSEVQAILDTYSEPGTAIDLFNKFMAIPKTSRAFEETRSSYSASPQGTVGAVLASAYECLLAAQLVDAGTADEWKLNPNRTQIDAFQARVTTSKAKTQKEIDAFLLQETALATSKAKAYLDLAKWDKKLDEAKTLYLTINANEKTALGAGPEQGQQQQTTGVAAATDQAKYNEQWERYLKISGHGQLISGFEKWQEGGATPKVGETEPPMEVDPKASENLDWSHLVKEELEGDQARCEKIKAGRQRPQRPAPYTDGTF